jgi:hypothetical protein
MNKTAEKDTTIAKARESRFVVGRAMDRAKDTTATWTPDKKIGVASWRESGGTTSKKVAPVGGE